MPRSIIHRTLVLAASTSIVVVSVMASPIAAESPATDSSRQTLQRRVEKDSDDRLIDGKAPEGPILLVFGGLAVAVVCLIFVVIRVNLNMPTTATGRQIMEERAKARTDLRLRGGNSQQTSRIGLESNLQSPSATPTMLRSDASDMSSTSPLRPGQGSRPPKTKAQRAALRGYSGSSFSRASGGERSYSSFASMMDVPMLSSSGRMGTTNSHESGQSDEYSKMGMGPSSRPIGPRGPQPQRQSQFGRAQDKRNSTLYRGTNLTLTRSGSGRTPALRPSAVTPSYHPAPGSPKHQQGQELRRYQCDSAEQSRRSSAANLLEDDYLAPAQGPSPYASAGSSSSDHSSGLMAAPQHPLSTSSHSRQPLQPGHYITSNYWKQQGQPAAWPQPSGAGGAFNVASSPNSMYYNASSQPPSASPHQGVFSAVDGPRGRDEESFGNYDNSRPGQFTQPVAEGNGRRGIRGAPAGARPMS